MAKTIEKAWGFEEVIVNTELYCAKFLHVLPGKQCSVHYHSLKDETFHVLSGTCRIQTSRVAPDPMPVLNPGESIRIIPGLPHRFGSVEGCILLEVSTHHDDQDVSRIEPSGDL